MTYYTTVPRKPFAEDVRLYVMTQFLPRWRVISSETGQREKARHFLFVVFVNVPYFGSRSSQVRDYLKHFKCISVVDFAFLKKMHNSSQYSYCRAVKCQTCHMLYQILYLLPIIYYICHNSVVLFLLDFVLYLFSVF